MALESYRERWNRLARLGQVLRDNEAAICEALQKDLGKPTVEIYCDSPRWKTEGYWSEQIANHGDLQQPPTVTEVFDACQRLISKSS
jgi:hypothetical protein